MHVIFLIGRHVIVHHQLDAVNVNAPRHHICGHKDGQLLLTEGQHHFFSFGLFQITGHPTALDSSFAEGPHHLPHGSFPRGKNNAAFHVALLQNLDKDVIFLVIEQNVGTLLHLGSRLAQGKLNCDRIPEEVVGKGAHSVRHGGREEQGLSLTPAMRGDAHDVLVESHVQHAVGFIQNQNLQRAEVNISKGEVGEHSTRSHNDNVCPFSKRFLLLGKFLPRASPINGEARDARIIGKALGGLVDLTGKLTGGHHNERLDFAVVGGVHNTVHGGQQKCRCLPRPRLGDPQDVFFLQRIGDRFALNGGGGFKPHRKQAILNVRMQIKGVESHFFFHGLSALLFCWFFHTSKLR